MKLALDRHFDRPDHGIRLDDVGFADRLMEALGPRQVVAPELNPVSREDAVRFVNGLPRSPRAMAWFEPPPAREGQEAGIERFRRRAGLTGPSERSARPEAELRLLELLDRRHADRQKVQSVLRGLDTSPSGARR